jgi:NADH-quinone oxidoreductase subunit E
MLNEREQLAIRETLDTYQTAGRTPTQARRAAAIDALMAVQRERGWLSDETLQELAAELQLSVAELDALASFYTRLFRHPTGRHRVYFCDSLSCWIMGGEALREQLRDRLGITPGETTADERFTLLPTVCLGLCEQAPVLSVDDDIYPITAATDLDEVLDGYA